MKDLLGPFKFISGLTVHISVLPTVWCLTLQKGPEKKIPHNLICQFQTSVIIRNYLFYFPS